MNILITGIAGFIGRNLCKELLKENYIIGVDNLSTGRLRNIEEFKENPNFKFINIDISELNLDEDIDVIINLASPASPEDYFKKPIDTLKAGSIGVFNILNIAKKKEATYIQASTSEVYGDPKEHPQKEEYWGNCNPIGVRSVYDESKRFAEATIMAYNREYNLDTRIIRIFNTYGPYMRKNDGRVIPNFINQALNNKDLVVYGDGNQTRSFNYVDDLVKCIVTIVSKKNLSGSILNIGNPNEITINNIADIIINKINPTLKKRYIKAQEDDPKQRCPNIERAKTILRWEPKVEIGEGLNKTIEYFKEET